MTDATTTPSATSNGNACAFPLKVGDVPRGGGIFNESIEAMKRNMHVITIHAPTDNI